MKKWQAHEGIDFHNSDVCFGKEYKADADKIDVAKISIRGRFPAKGWGYLEDSHEMAVVVRGVGFIETKKGKHEDLIAGDVVYVKPLERFCWGGDMDMIVSCGPAFEPGKHHLEEDL